MSVCLRDLGSGVVPLCEGAHWNASHGRQRPRAKPVPAPHCPSKAPPHRCAALAGSLSSKLPLKLGLLLGSGDNLYALEALQRQALEALQRQALHPMQRQREARAPPPVCISPCGATLQKVALSVLHAPSAPGTTTKTTLRATEVRPSPPVPAPAQPFRCFVCRLLPPRHLTTDPYRLPCRAAHYFLGRLQQKEFTREASHLKSLCGGGVPSSHPSLGLSVFFLSYWARD